MLHNVSPRTAKGEFGSESERFQRRPAVSDELGRGVGQGERRRSGKFFERVLGSPFFGYFLAATKKVINSHSGASREAGRETAFPLTFFLLPPLQIYSIMPANDPRRPAAYPLGPENP